jgi:putative DNA methylase
VSASRASAGDHNRCTSEAFPAAPFAGELTARAHRPLYQMHRYFARRPHNVMAALVEHYSQPGELILDPFVGGGVTVVEAVLAGRRAIGQDTNPLATFIGRGELLPFDETAYVSAAQRVARAHADATRDSYVAPCPHCSAAALVNWYEYATAPVCSDCGEAFLINTAEKIGPGSWRCPACHKAQRVAPTADMPAHLVAVAYECERCGSFTSEDQPPGVVAELPTAALAEELGGAFPDFFPWAEVPDCNMQRESALHKKGFTHFYSFFTERQLRSLLVLRTLIEEEDATVRDLLRLTFSATLRYTNRFVTRNPSWRGDRPLEWVGTGYWIPTVFLDPNVTREFERRAKAVVRGKRDYLQLTGGQPPTEGSSPRAVLDSTAVQWSLQTGSSTRIELPDASVDAIVTDPPYGSYVHYADMSNFWAAWLRGVPGFDGLIDDSEEAVVARKKFPRNKSLNDYQRLLEGVFRECHRVLKPGRCMVLTFNNREPRAWAALMLAAVRAGLDVPPHGITYQEGIANYRHTARTRRVGSLHGDFIVTFMKTSADAVASVAVDDPLSEAAILDEVTQVLRNGPCEPALLARRLYASLIPKLLAYLRHTSGVDDAAELLSASDRLDLFDSHRRDRLERHFAFDGERWKLRDAS